MASTNTSSSFMDLPLELREQIYKDALVQSTVGTSLSRTCYQVYTEARKFLYQRPLVFRSQEALYEWLKKTPTSVLFYITEVYLHLQDVDHTPLLRSCGGACELNTTPRLSLWELYDNEISHLQDAFRQIPNVKTFTLCPLLDQYSTIYRDFLENFLHASQSMFPSLSDLRLEGNFYGQKPGFLSRFENLQSLSFDGFPWCAPQDIANILARIERLTKLSLTSQPTLLSPDAHAYSAFPTKERSTISESTQNLMRWESGPSLATSPMSLFTTELFTSLHDNNMLNSLSISLSYTPDYATLLALERYLESVSITELELDWFKLDPFLLERYRLLGGCLRTLWIRATIEADACDILKHIVENKKWGDAQHLTKVVLIRATVYEEPMPAAMCDGKDMDIDDPEGDSHIVSPHITCHNGHGIAGAKRELRDLGVQVEWYTEDL